MKKKHIASLLAISLFLAVFMRCCIPRFPAQIICNFWLCKRSFVAVSEYIESLGWEEYGMDRHDQLYCFSFRRRTDDKLDVSRPKEFRDKALPEAGVDVKQAVRLLFRELNYESIHRTSRRGNTIIFSIEPAYFNWDYYNQGVCYVIGGGEPTPEVNLDYCTEELRPLGGNWYYWNGHCYFG